MGAYYYNYILCFLIKMLDGLVGGEGGIRTHGTLARTPVFKTGTLNHSVTSPTAAEHNDFL